MTETIDLTHKLATVAKKIGVTFTLKSAPIALTELFSPVGLLPGLTRRADQLASLCLGYGLGAKFEDETKSLLGVRVAFDDFTPDIVRIFCITDVLYELIKTSASSTEVALDELMYD